MRVNKKVVLYLFLFFLLLFALLQYGITKIIGFSLYPDEFGYWASAANAIGWNWSEVASLGSYYSYGYSLILTPILYLFNDSITAYQIAVVVNMLLLIAGFFCLLSIKRKLFETEVEWKDIMLCAIAVFYPPWLFYTQMTMTEAMLMFLFVLLCYLFIKVLEKKSIGTVVCMALVIAYLYAIHMRTVGVVISGCMIMFFFFCCEKRNRKCGIGFFLTLIILGLVLELVKDITIQEVYTYADSQVIAMNDYSGRWWIFKEILTWKGFKDLLVSIIGKIFYLGTASFGIFYWAMFSLIRQTGIYLRKFVKKEQINNREWMSVFLLLSVLGELLICAMFMYRPGYVDGLIYGRYTEFVMPILLILGIKQMEQSKGVFWKSGAIAVGTGCAIPVLLSVIQSRGMERARGYHMVGMSYLLQDEYAPMMDFFVKTWILTSFIMLLITLVVWMEKRMKHMEWILCTIAVIELGLGIQASEHYIYPSNSSHHMDRKITDAIKEEIQPDDSILFIDDGRLPCVDFLQMQLREYSIHIISQDSADIEEKIQSADYVIQYNEMETEFDWDMYHSERLISNQYTLYYTKEE